MIAASATSPARHPELVSGSPLRASAEHAVVRGSAIGGGNAARRRPTFVPPVKGTLKQVQGDELLCQDF
jgi:hypothetical protein